MRERVSQHVRVSPHVTCTQGGSRATDESRKPTCVGPLWGQAVDPVVESRSSEFPEDTGALSAPVCGGLVPQEPGTRLLAFTLG